jgi:hypothetical protein
MLKNIWRFCGSIRLTFWVLLLISCTLAAGSYYIKYYPKVFRPLNNLLFQDWFRIYGLEYSDSIWWLGVLFGLLTALGINTVVCTADRLYSLWSKRKQMDFKAFVFKVTPSLIHGFFFVILSGHLLSLISGMNTEISTTPGVENILPGQASVSILEQTCDFYDSPRLLKGLLKQCAVSLELHRPGETTFKKIGFLRPYFWQGFSFHLSRDKKATGLGLQIAVKRDPGLKLILTGFTAMVLLMLWYFPKLHKDNKGG